ncbi:MAG: hypothetical protein WCK35_21165 [Chloroflexota bacterium]
MNTKTLWLHKYSLQGYFILAYAISWSIGIPLALVAQGKASWQVPICTLPVRLWTHAGGFDHDRAYKGYGWN